MQTTITSKSGKTYELTAEITASKTQGTYVTDTDGKLVRGEDGNWLKQGVEDQMCANAKIDGKRLGFYAAPTQAEAEKKMLAAAKRYVEVAEADAAWYDRCKVVAATPAAGAYMETPRGTSAADFFVGQRVSIYSRGTARVGLVEKVGKTNVHVVYVTASTGALWRKSDKFKNVAILDRPEGVEAELDTEGRRIVGEMHLPKKVYRIAPAAPDSVDEPCDCSCHTTGDAGMPGCCSDSAYLSDGELGDISAQALAASTTDEEWATETERRLAGLKTERRSLRARIPAGTNLRPELQARLEPVEAEIARLCPYGLCDTTGRQRVTSPRCYRCQEDDEPELDDRYAGDDAHLAQYDDDPSPYAGTYSEE